MFKVDWLRPALDELAVIWHQADSAGRPAIKEASHRIDRLLSSAPDQVGESRSPGERIHFEYPLGILFEVNPNERRVRILHAWDIRRKA